MRNCNPMRSRNQWLLSPSDLCRRKQELRRTMTCSRPLPTEPSSRRHQHTSAEHDRNNERRLFGFDWKLDANRSTRTLLPLSLLVVPDDPLNERQTLDRASTTTNCHQLRAWMTSYKGFGVFSQPSSIAKNWSKIAISKCPAQPFRTKWGSIAKN